MGSTRTAFATSTLEHWYKQDESDSSLDPARDAFSKAKTLFSQNLTKDEQKKSFIDQTTSIEDILKVVNEAKDQYVRKRHTAKAWRWLSAFSSRFMYYGAVLDTLSQHHPEYVSLAWGAIKFIFMGILNKEELMSTFAKALCRIADSLPRQELASVLYPTKQIKQGVAQLYAHLMGFLVKAMKWYREGALKHIVHSITQPVGIRYKNILESIEDCSRNVDKWVIASAQAEQRDMHALQQKTLLNVETTKSVAQSNALTVDEIMKLVVSMAPQLTQFIAGQLDTNQRVFDLQLSNMLTFTTGSSILDPETSFRYGLLKRNRHKLNFSRPPTFWQSPKLKLWTNSDASALVIVTGPYSQREQAKDFGINVIEAVRSTATPVLWVLSNHNQSIAGTITTIDILKSLVQQAMRLNRAFQSERACALSCARIQSAVQESEWFDILGSALAGLRLVYIVFDIGTLGRTVLALSDDFSWPLAFISLFQTLASKASQTVLKIVLIGYGEAQFLQMPGIDAPQEFFVNIGPPGRAVPRTRRNARKNHFVVGGH